jgi:L-ribulokinase
MADVMNMPIRIHRSEQSCAAGAAMFAATAAGLYPNVMEAMNAMGQGFDVEYKPRAAAATTYATRYKKYLAAGAQIEHKPMAVAEPTLL